MARVQLINISKRFEKNTAVNSVDLTIKDKEFLVLVGPSGCGKTTTLRMIAGLEEITEGEILIDDVKINDLSPRDRDVAMVFQNYALYPHMKVYKNMAFGLLVRKISKSIIDERVNEAAKILGIEELLDRKPRELSGGQRQRVAIGRAIVRKPKVFLFDEPLSNLDAKLRVQMRAELLKIHERLLTTIIYVTHDQLEAMTLADCIVVMNDGNIMQVGAPMDVYNNPQNLFVAGFIGSPTMNFFDVHMIEKDGIFYARGKNFKLKIPKENYQRYQRVKGREAILGIRPEHIYNKKLKKPFPGGELLKVMIEVVEPVGSEILLLGTCGTDQVTASVDPQTNVKPHTEMEFLVDMNCMHLFDAATEEVY